MSLYSHHFDKAAKSPLSLKGVGVPTPSSPLSLAGARPPLIKTSPLKLQTPGAPGAPAPLWKTPAPSIPSTGGAPAVPPAAGGSWMSKLRGSMPDMPSISPGRKSLLAGLGGLGAGAGVTAATGAAKLRGMKADAMNQAATAASANWGNMSWGDRIGQLLKMLFGGGLDKDFITKLMTPQKAAAIRFKIACVAADIHNIRPDVRFSADIEALAALRRTDKSASAEMTAMLDGITTAQLKEAFYKFALTWEENAKAELPEHTTVEVTESNGPSPLAKSASYYQALAVATGLEDEASVKRW